MLQSSNQVPSIIPSASSTISTPPVGTNLPTNDNSLWTQIKPTVPQSVQPHGIKHIF